MEEAQMKELEELCRPVAEWAEKNLTPHDHIVINAANYRVVSEIVGVPFGLI